MERDAEKKAPRRLTHDTMCESILINSATFSLSAVWERFLSASEFIAR